jgi:hypothetical protein
MKKLRTGQARNVGPKLLKIRDFQAGSGFPCRQKHATILSQLTGNEHRLGLFPHGMVFHAKPAIGRAGFRAYMLQTHP